MPVGRGQWCRAQSRKRRAVDGSGPSQRRGTTAHYLRVKRYASAAKHGSRRHSRNDSVPSRRNRVINAMRSLIIDDEAGARLRLRRLLQAQDCVEIVGGVEDGMAAVSEIERLRPDLLFLDIQMPGLDGFSVLKALPHDFPLPLVIFITGFHEHAMKAFEAKALAYLLKPIETDRLNEMVERAWRLHRSTDDRSQDDLKVKSLVKEATRRLERIVARKLDKYWLVDPSDVVFFQMDNGTWIMHGFRLI